MLQNAGDLLILMKDKTDALVASDEKIQQFLSWLNQKALSVKVAYKPAALRAFYLVRALDLDLARALARDLDLDSALALARDLDSARASALDLGLDSALDSDLDSARALTRALDLDSALARASASANANARALARALALALALAREAELQHPLQELKAQLPNLNNSEESKKIYLEWWQVNGQNWIKRLNTVMIEQRNIGHDWQFTQPQLELLSQYYYANKLLVDCLNSAYYVSHVVRQEIENTLLLPIDIVRK
jgi:hypothetical protein